MSNPTDIEDLDPYARDRDKALAETPLTSDSLKGSYFRAPDQDDPDAEAAWLDGEPCATIEGMVVAEVFATSQSMTYLVEFYGKYGATGYQRLIELDRMVGQRWAFYDSEAWLTGRAEETTKTREEA